MKLQWVLPATIIVADFIIFLYLYNTASIEAAWTYVFAVTSVFCAVNLADSIRQTRVQKKLGINSIVEAVTSSVAEQEGVRLMMSLLWLSVGILALYEVRSIVSVWVLLAGAFAFRLNALLSINLRQRIKRMNGRG